MGGTAILIAVSWGLLGGVIVVLLGVFVWASTTGRRKGIDAAKLAERERTWFALVVVLLVALLFATIFFTPYGRGQPDATAQTMEVRAQQFAFVMTPQTVKVGEPVQFRLTAADVNHGFAVFDSSHKFLFQVQVMPGKTQLYRYTFDEPGTYTVECFEYCGLGHDKMFGSFRVAP